MVAFYIATARRKRGDAIRTIERSNEMSIVVVSLFLTVCALSGDDRRALGRARGSRAGVSRFSSFDATLSYLALKDEVGRRLWHNLWRIGAPRTQSRSSSTNVRTCAGHRRIYRVLLQSSLGGDYIGGKCLRHVGHSCLMSIHRVRHFVWKKWLHGVTMRSFVW